MGVSRAISGLQKGWSQRRTGGMADKAFHLYCILQYQLHIHQMTHLGQCQHSNFSETLYMETMCIHIYHHSNVIIAIWAVSHRQCGVCGKKGLSVITNEKVQKKVKYT